MGSRISVNLDVMVGLDVCFFSLSLSDKRIAGWCGVCDSRQGYLMVGW